MSRPKVTIEITVPGFNKLADYLEAHEHDIANEENDFGDLRELYVLVFDDNQQTEVSDGRS